MELLAELLEVNSPAHSLLSATASVNANRRFFALPDFFLTF
jgi:hypothetical protein